MIPSAAPLDPIHRAIPHRPPFLFLDRLIEVDTAHVVAERELRAAEAHFSGHYPDYPIMPGVLLCEAVFQAGAVCLAQEGLEEGVPVLARIEEAKFRRPTFPGQLLRIEARRLEKMGRFRFMAGSVSRDGQEVMRVRFALAIAPAGNGARS